MIDFLRATHAQLLLSITILIIVITTFLVSKKYIPDEFKDLSKKVLVGIIALVVFLYLLFAFRFVSINNIPKATLDQSVIKDRQEYFERDAKKTIENSKHDSVILTKNK